MHVGLILPQKVKKELTEATVMPNLVLAGRLSSLKKSLPSNPDSNTSVTVGLGRIGTGKGVTRPWRSGQYIGGADTQDKVSQGLDVFRETVHLDYKPEVTSWDVGTTIPHVDIFLKRTKQGEQFLVMKPPGFWYHPLLYLHLGENSFCS